MARLKNKLAQHALAPASQKDFSLGTERDILTRLPLARIEPDPNQPRRDLGDLDGLAASIREIGVVQPIIVSVVPDAAEERYRVLAGERRYHASVAAGKTHIPAIVRTVEDHLRLQLQIIENLHRKDLSPFEEARAYQALMDQFRETQEEVAKRVGKSQESVSETLRLLTLSEEIQTTYREANEDAGGKITRSLLVEIARRPEEEQETLWDQARRGMLTVQKARSLRRRSPTARHVIRLDGVTVTIEFETPPDSPEDIRTALQNALQSLTS